MGVGRTVVELVIGGTVEDCAAAVLDAVQRAERGEAVEPRRVLSFESWEAWRRSGLAEVAAMLAEIEAEAGAEAEGGRCG